MHTGSLARQILLAMASVGASSGCQSSQPANGHLVDSPHERPTDAPASKPVTDAGPFADRFPGPNFEAQRACFAKPELFARTEVKVPAAVPCPSQSELVQLGFGPHDDPHAMSGCTTLTSGPSEWNGECCYLFTGCTHLGRPFVVDGAPRQAVARPRRGWTTFGERTRARARPKELDSDHDALATAWAADGLAEHASIASFSRFALDLLALAAPSELVAAAHRAALDEIEHARLCFGLASHYAGRTVGPGALDVRGAVGHGDLASAAALAFDEGCIGETEAAVVAAGQLEGACVPMVRRALARIAADEADHATLAWRFVAWAIAEGGRPVRDRVAAAWERASRASLAPASSESTDIWRSHGRLGSAETASVRGRAQREVIAPCAHALLS